MNGSVNAAAGPSTGSHDTRTVRVLSFNIWGLKYISKKRDVRIRAIAQYLAASEYDIVCLQECWVYTDFELIKDTVDRTLPYARFFNSGALGSGLAIFTRYPLLSAQVLPFDLSGTPQQAFAGDFFVNKAAGKVVVQHPLLGELEIWTTHMHAGGEHAPDTRQAHRIGESWQLANAIRAGAARGRFVMVMGDFNAQPTSIPIGMMRTHAGLTDSFLETHPLANHLDPLPASPEDAVHLNGMSCDSSLNTWSAAKNIPPNIRAQGGKRLDYIFYGQPDLNRGWQAPTGGGRETTRSGKVILGQDEWIRPPRLRCRECELVLTELVPGEIVSYSDHFGLSATFTIDDPGEVNDKGSSGSPSTSADDTDNLRDASSTFATSRQGDPTPSPSVSDSKTASTLPPADPSALDLISGAQRTMSAYALLSRGTATLHLRLSLLFLVVLAGLAIGSAWQPKPYIQPIFTILAALLGSASATLFYLGFVWGRWEAGMLAELAEEMRLETQVIYQKSRAYGCA